MAGEDQFVNAVADMAAEVWDFHDRFGFGRGNNATRACHEVIIERAPMLREEFEEMLEAANSKDESETCHEAADVLFVAIGNMVSLGIAGFERRSERHGQECGEDTRDACNSAGHRQTSPDPRQAAQVAVGAINLTHRWPAMPHKCDAIGRI